MPEELSRNISCRFDFECGRAHFEGRPVFVLDEVVKEFWRRFGVDLVGWVRDTGTIRDDVL